MKDQPANTQRRDFLKTAGGAAAGAIAAGFPGIISGQTVTNAIKVGLVGCGGRGSGAASQALAADDYAELTAVADIDQAQIDHCLQSLQTNCQERAPGEGGNRQPVSRPGRFSEGDRQQGGRGAAGHASRFPAAPPGRVHRRQQARVLREAGLDRCARRALRHADGGDGEAEEPVAGGRLLLALQQHDPGDVPAGGERRHRTPGGLLRHLLHQSR